LVTLGSVPARAEPPPPAAAAPPSATGTAPAAAAAPSEATPPAPSNAGAVDSPAVATAAPAGTAAPRPPTKRFPRLVNPSMSHRFQFGIAMLPGTGYRGIFPYQEMINCGQPNKRVCTGRLKAFLDVQPSFGFAHHWDVLLDLRFGLEQDFTQSRQFAVAPGVRYWVDPDEHAKFFATIQVAFDTTDQNNSALKNTDVALRNSNGFMYEIMRNFGAYVQFGETIGFVRWLRFEIDVGAGIQARLP
jgi:hypothetical protein